MWNTDAQTVQQSAVSEELWKHVGELARVHSAAGKIVNKVAETSIIIGASRDRSVGVSGLMWRAPSARLCTCVSIAERIPARFEQGAARSARRLLNQPDCASGRTFQREPWAKEERPYLKVASCRAQRVRSSGLTSAGGEQVDCGAQA